MLLACATSRRTSAPTAGGGGGGGSVLSIGQISANGSGASGGRAVTIPVTGLVGTPAITIGGQVPGSIVYVNSTTITCTLPAYSGTPSAQGSAVDLVIGAVTKSGAVTYYPDASGTPLVASPNFTTGSLGPWTDNSQGSDTVVFSSLYKRGPNPQSIRSRFVTNDDEGGIISTPNNSSWLLAAGVSCRVFMLIEAASMPTVGQVKLAKFLNFTVGGGAQYFSSGIGPEFFVGPVGGYLGGAPSNAIEQILLGQFQDQVWMEFLWMMWRFGNGTGRTVTYRDGLKVQDRTGSDIGPDANDQIEIGMGGTYMQNTGQTCDIYSSDHLVMPGGWIAPN